MRVPNLRSVINRLGVKSMGSKPAKALIAKMIELKRAKLGHETSRNQAEGVPVESTTRKGPNCAFRLVNVLLSDCFRVAFGNLYAPQGRELMESGVVLHDDEYFWKDIETAFINPTHELNATEFNVLQSNRGELASVPAIDPGKCLVSFLCWPGLPFVQLTLPSCCALYLSRHYSKAWLADASKDIHGSPLCLCNTIR